MSRRLALAIAFFFCVTTTLYAQRGGFGGGDRGGFGGGSRGGFGGGDRGGSSRGGFGGGSPFGGSSRGGDRGGSSRGGFSGGSPFGGSSRGGDRGSSSRGTSSRGGDRGRGGSSPFSGRGSFGSSTGGFESFIRRLDRNGNGTLDRDEMQGPAQFIVQRMGLDPNRPVPISKLIESASRMRSGGSSTASNEPKEPEPLVPGFDVDIGLPPVPGFGDNAELLAVNVEDRDIQYAEDRMKRYDRNRDGFLSKSEIASGRWSDDPFTYDRNGDGKLTASEMAVRYARRRVNEEDSKKKKNGPKFYTGGSSSSGGSSGSASSGRGGSRGGGGSSSGGEGDRVGRFVEFTMQRYDTDKNGYLSKGEIEKMRTKPEGADKNRDGRLDKKELTAWMSERFSQASSGRGNREGGDSRRAGGGSRGGSQEQEALSYRVKSAGERLESKGLNEEVPGWFLDDDYNGDGQIAMSEYTDQWSEKTLNEYYKFDANKDGMISFKEVSLAQKDGYTKSAPTAKNTGSGSTVRRGGSSDRLEEKPISQRYLTSSMSMIKKYDKNGDGMLSTEELASVRLLRSYENLDADMDGQVTPRELAEAMLAAKKKKSSS